MIHKDYNEEDSVVFNPSVENIEFKLLDDKAEA